MRGQARRTTGVCGVVTLAGLQDGVRGEEDWQIALRNRDKPTWGQERNKSTHVRTGAYQVVQDDKHGENHRGSAVPSHGQGRRDEVGQGSDKEGTQRGTGGNETHTTDSGR